MTLTSAILGCLWRKQNKRNRVETVEETTTVMMMETSQHHIAFQKQDTIKATVILTPYESKREWKTHIIELIRSGGEMNVENEENTSNKSDDCDGKHQS